MRMGQGRGCLTECIIRRIDRERIGKEEEKLRA